MKRGKKNKENRGSSGHSTAHPINIHKDLRARLIDSIGTYVYVCDADAETNKQLRLALFSIEVLNFKICLPFPYTSLFGLELLCLYQPDLIVK